MAENSVTTYFDSYKKARLESGLQDSITSRRFYVVIFTVLAWGFLVNAAMVYLLGDAMIQAAHAIKWWMLLLAYLVPTFVGIYIAVRSTNPLISFLGYNLVVLPIGLTLAMIIPTAPVYVITKAMGLTAMVTLTMMVLAMTVPQLFLGMARTLLVSLLVGLLAEVIATFLLGYRGFLFDWFFVIIFSCYIGYDVARAQAFPKTLDNAVDCALDIYIDIVNLFIRLLCIFSRSNN